MKTQRPYPEYKDSGVEWLGPIPAHWVCGPIYSRYAVQLGKMLDGSQITGEHLCSYLRNVDVQWGRVNTYNLPQMDFSPADRIRFALRRGDLLVCEGGEVGRAAHWLGELDECYYQKAIHRLRPFSPAEEPRFMFYVLLYAAKLGVFVAGGNPNTIDHLPAEKLRKYRFPFPPSDEQRPIAVFLDRETARIDGLVAKKERLVELLQEKRAALISHVVTKGLNPDAPMKDSGVEWLGQIPAHWSHKPLRRYTQSMCDGPFGSDMKSSHYADSGVRLIRLQNIEQGYFDDGDKVFIPESHFQSLPGHDALPGDLLVAGLGDASHPVGRACLLPVHIERAMVKADCFRVRLDQERLTHGFTMHFLCSSAARAAVSDQIRGATRERMNLSGLASIGILVPPISEQRAISDAIVQQTAKLDALIAKTQRSIERMQEYRTALISAAVTGKIDVRQPPASASGVDMLVSRPRA